MRSVAPVRSGRARRALFNFYGFLFLLGAEHDYHALAFEDGHLVNLAILLEIICKTQEQNFALLFEKDGATLEEDIGFHLCTFLKETDGMFELEVVVMIIGLGSETNLLHNNLCCLGLLFLLAFLLLVKELLVFKHTADRRLGGG